MGSARSPHGIFQDLLERAIDVLTSKNPWAATEDVI
jgi:hypothetical protein